MQGTVCPSTFFGASPPLARNSTPGASVSNVGLGLAHHSNIQQGLYARSSPSPATGSVQEDQVEQGGAVSSVEVQVQLPTQYTKALSHFFSLRGLTPNSFGEAVDIFRAFNDMAMNTSLPLTFPEIAPLPLLLHVYYAQVASTQLSAIFTKSIEIVLEPFDNTIDLRHSKINYNTVIELGDYRPPDELWVFIQTAEIQLVQMIYPILQHLQQSCEHTARGLVIRLLLDKVWEQLQGFYQVLLEPQGPKGAKWVKSRDDWIRKALRRVELVGLDAAFKGEIGAMQAAKELEKPFLRRCRMAEVIKFWPKFPEYGVGV